MLRSRRDSVAFCLFAFGHRVSGSSMCRRRPRSLGFRGVGVLSMVLALLVIGCGASTSTDASLEATYTRVASSVVDAKFRDLVRQWLSGDVRSRAALDGALEPYGRRYQTDPLGRTALVLRAFNALEAKQDSLARELAGAVYRGAAGVNRDLAQLVLGVVARR